ncbi:uncharacterized protein LOC109863655 [Pseudomyrmex gracilis]|uniref:uncharacterized protein LOC109863655 n=1 Tax=Pseudomyrmex gracilis TaxID=219809 RepID=UPI000994AC20|nr:uncharacterized protein LOC109863655 [Pseudomyrmex gracilis]
MKYEYGISLSQLRTSLKYRSKEYFLENSLHGISYIVDSSLRKWERYLCTSQFYNILILRRILWLILTVSSLIATIWVMLIIWDRFQREPTMSEVDTSTENIKLDFPQIFLCLDWSQLNHSNLREACIFPLRLTQNACVIFDIF